MPRFSNTAYSYDEFKGFGWSQSQFDDFVRRYGISARADGYYSFQSGGDVERYIRFLQDYFRRAEPLRGTRFWDQVLANPSLAWQESGMNRGANEAFYNGRENDAYKYLAELLDSSSQDKYNATPSQVERDRAAGLNDAISGQIAGGTPGADAAPLEGGPSPGMTPSDQAAMDQVLLGGFASVFTGLSTGIGVLEGVTRIKDLLAGIGLKGAQETAADAAAAANVAGIGLTQSQKQGQDVANREALRDSFMKTFLNSIPAPADGQNFDPQSVMSSFPRGSYSPEEQKYLDQLVDSGFFFDKQGVPSLAVQKGYAGDVAGMAQGMEQFARSSAVVGGHDMDLGSAFRYYYGKYARFDEGLTELRYRMEDYRLKHQQLMIDIAEYEKTIASHGVRSAAATADEAESMRDYNVAVYNSESGEAQNKVLASYRAAQEASSMLDKIYSEFDASVAKEYIADFEQFGRQRDANGKAVGSFPEMMIANNAFRGAALSGYFNARQQRSTLPTLKDATDYMSRLIPNFSSFSISKTPATAGPSWNSSPTYP